MEVHQHTHSEASGQHKKWTHYLWEFLMLFLAVFCGFLAENFREKQLEHRKEKEYMHALIKDIQRDTSLINRNIFQTTFVIIANDSLENMLVNCSENPAFLNKLYYENTVSTLTDFWVDFTKGTFDELKSSGSLRLVNSAATKEKIQEYETVKEWCNDQHIYVYESIGKAYYYATDIFDISCYRKYNDWINKDWTVNLFASYDSVKRYISDKPRLLTADRTILMKYVRLVNNQKAQIMGYRSYVQMAEEKAVELINTIKQEYNLK